MNIFELVIVLVAVAASFFCGKFFGTHYGVVGWVVGSLLGCVSAVLTYFTLHSLINLWYKWRPVRPICRKGKCTADDYELLDVSSDGAFFKCSCGMKYLSTGHRFMEIDEDGSTHSYMQRRGYFGKWEKDFSEK